MKRINQDIKWSNQDIKWNNRDIIINNQCQIFWLTQQTESDDQYWIFDWPRKKLIQIICMVMILLLTISVKCFDWPNRLNQMTSIEFFWLTQEDIDWNNLYDNHNKQLYYRDLVIGILDATMYQKRLVPKILVTWLVLDICLMCYRIVLHGETFQHVFHPPDNNPDFSSLFMNQALIQILTQVLIQVTTQLLIQTTIKVLIHVPTQVLNHFLIQVLIQLRTLNLSIPTLVGFLLKI